MSSALALGRCQRDRWVRDSAGPPGMEIPGLSAPVWLDANCNL